MPMGGIFSPDEGIAFRTASVFSARSAVGAAMVAAPAPISLRECLRERFKVMEFWIGHKANHHGAEKQTAAAAGAR